MLQKLRRILLTTTLLFVFSSAVAVHAFVVRNIVIHGNQRLSNGTIFSYLSIHPGQRYTDMIGDTIIETLFKTGFFNNVRLQRSGNTLIVTVSERPTIGLLKIEGNKEIKTEQLYKVLKKMHLVEGDVFDTSKLNQIRIGLENEYSRLGHYVAVVNTRVQKEPKNQVALTIQITEGPLTRVNSITFKGNKNFSDWTLRETFQLSTSRILSFFNHHDRFSNEQLDKDLTSLRDFYFNHGYLKFKVVDKSVKFNSTHTRVNIQITIDPGPVYRISGFRVDEHDKYLDQIQKMIDIKPGEVFQRSKIIALNKRIANFFADRGYAYPKIFPETKLNDKNNTVFIAYHVNVGERIYVRHIKISGNEHTNERVIRSQLRQMEAALYSRGKIEESKRRIQNLGYLTDTTYTPSPVAGHPDQVDLDYHVKEVRAGKASVNGGYSDIEGFIYGANVAEPNFMGSGKFVSLGFTRSKFSSNYSFAYNNPFYTIDGVGRGFNIYYTHTTPGKVNLESYTMGDFGTHFSYTIPLSEYNTASLGAGYDYIDIRNVDRTRISPTVVQFLDKHEPAYNNFVVTGGITHQSLDRIIFPNRGNLQQIAVTASAPIFKSSLGYLTSTYSGKWYWSLGQSGFVVEPHTILGFGAGYGRDKLPFFNNFYGGGIKTLPGFEPNSLGPKNPHDTTQAMGGNLEMFAGVNFFAPTFFHGKIRVGGAFNIGNIYDTQRVHTNPSVQYEQVKLNTLRMSAGVLVSWWWPLGAPIDIALGFPLNKKAGDETSIFGFSMGGSL